MSTVAEFVASLFLEPNEESFEHGEKMIEGIKHSIEAFIGAEAIAKVKEMVAGVVETAVAAKHMGERVGISTEAVQELGYASSVTGGSAEGMQVSLQHLARGMQELESKGTGPAADGLQKLGISFSSIKGKSPDKVLEVLADRFEKMPDGPAKTAAAMDLFGRSGTSLIPMLNKGEKGIQGLREEAERLGVVIDEEGIKKAEEFEIAQKRLGATLTGIKNTAVMAMLPALQEMIEGLSEWVAENRKAIASTLEAVIHGIAEAFSAVGSVIKEVTQFFKDHEEIATAVMIALGAVIATFAAEAVVSWAVAFAPIVTAVAVVAGLILMIEHLGEALDELAGKSQGVDEARQVLELRRQGMSEEMAISQVRSQREASASHTARDASNKELSIDEIQKMTGQMVGAAPERTPIASSQSVTFGPTNINIVASKGMSETELSGKMKDAAREVHKDAVRSAYDALAGGRR